MKRGKNKKGQFYIIAAIIIIITIVGFFLYRNYVRVPSGDVKIYDLEKELKIETGSVYDHGTYKQKNTNILVKDWTHKYYEYSKGQQVEDWIFVYGNFGGVTALTFSTVTSGSVGIITSVGSYEVPIEITQIGDEPLPVGAGGDINATFEGFTYELKLKKGENFFFVIRSGSYLAES